jgi:hypothetical protein
LEGNVFRWEPPEFSEGAAKLREQMKLGKERQISPHPIDFRIPFRSCGNIGLANAWPGAGAHPNLSLSLRCAHKALPM